jgi:hypothetical protein
MLWFAAVDEGRKRVILIAASILAAHKLADWSGGPAAPKHVAAISDSVRIAEKIMLAIDERWPTPSTVNGSGSKRC